MIFIEEDLYKRTAGYNGEVAVDYFLKFLPQKEYVFFPNIRLPFQDTFFQIDTLLLSRKFALILEVKNISGTLFFDEKSRQFIRIQFDGKEEGFDSPISQAQRQSRLFNHFLKLHGIPDIPVEFLVVISRSSTLLKPLGSPIFQKVCHANSLNHKIDLIEKIHQKKVHDHKTTQKVSRLLSKKHVPEVCDIKKLYGIERQDVLTGVQCPACAHLGMDYRHGKWVCPKCRVTSKDAHLAALQDYFLLISPTITNAEFRRFLHLPSRSIAQKLLRTLNLPSTGSFKNTVYKLRM